MNDKGSFLFLGACRSNPHTGLSSHWLKSKWDKICPLVEMEAADGKRRKVQTADTKGLEKRTGKKVLSSENYKALYEKIKKRLK